MIPAGEQGGHPLSCDPLITVSGREVANCFPPLLDLHMGLDKYAMKWENTGLFDFILRHYFLTKPIKKSSKSLLLLFHYVFSLLGNIAYQNTGVKKYLKILPLCKEQHEKIPSGLIYQHSGLSVCVLLFKQDQTLIILHCINTLENNP